MKQGSRLERDVENNAVQPYLTSNLQCNVVVKRISFCQPSLSCWSSEKVELRELRELREQTTVFSEKDKAIIENDFEERGWSAYTICKEHAGKGWVLSSVKRLHAFFL